MPDVLREKRDKKMNENGQRSSGIADTEQEHIKTATRTASKPCEGADMKGIPT